MRDNPNPPVTPTHTQLLMAGLFLLRIIPFSCLVLTCFPQSPVMPGALIDPWIVYTWVQHQVGLTYAGMMTIAIEL